MTTSHILGFPRMGVHRELKHALEAYWKGTADELALRRAADELKERHWAIQRDAGLSTVATGDFSFYDHVLDTIAVSGAMPARFGQDEGPVPLETYFRMARGDTSRNIPAMEMTKWFDTNYHYIVPEFSAETRFRYLGSPVVADTIRARSLGHAPRPVLLGPITFLSLGKVTDNSDRWTHLDDLLAVYAALIAELQPHCEWIQIDEPILCTDLPDGAAAHVARAYAAIRAAATNCKLLLATYFENLNENQEIALSTGCDALHVDLKRGRDQLEGLLHALPESMKLSAGVIDGRNIWKADLEAAFALLKYIENRIGSDRLMVASSCSLLHTPVDLAEEKKLDPELRDWLAFATQKCVEVATLASVLNRDDKGTALAENAASLARRRASARTTNPAVRERAAVATTTMYERSKPYEARRPAQAERLGLPELPTTTIGSFPQTAEIRRVRRAFKSGTLDLVSYTEAMRAEIRDVVARQEALGLDVLVHGEPERNDMVEYFGEQLEGFCFTENGWVQSYGSRCVKPPVIFGDVSRPRPMTVPWTTFAQSCTQKPMKGMLTGPVTILCWSFVRDDAPRAEVCKQIALAIRDEVADLEAAGTAIIQIDEAALREGMPLRAKDHEDYLRWAVDCFRLASACVRDDTQIHTHMCYSEFNAIVRWIAAMDADVISVESSRSGMELLDAFKAFDYPNEIGPGVYDIHSPRVPSKEEMLALLRRALEVIPEERLWVNPDCGLKTRAWPETEAALRNMVDAAKELRAVFATA